MGRREENKAAKRRALRQAALQRFREQGYDSTSIEQIAGDAGVARGTFYLYFPDRASLLDGLVDAWFEPLLELLAEEHERLTVATTRAESLAIYEDIGGQVAELALEHGEILLLAFQEARTPGEAGEVIRRREAQVTAVVVELTALAADRGLIDAPHPDVAARVVLGAVERMFYDVLATAWSDDPRVIAQETVRLLTASLGLARGVVSVS